MKIESYNYPQSSFLSIEKDFSLIVNQILRNERLKRLIFWDKPTALTERNLTQEESFGLLGTQIKIVPKIYVDKLNFCYLMIRINDTVMTTNPQYRNSYIHFDIICHYDQWQLNDLSLRPYKIAAELDSLFNNKRLTGIGLTQFVGASYQNYTDEFGGVTLTYRTVHGLKGEDSKDPLNPAEQSDIVENFNQIFNDPNVL